MEVLNAYICVPFETSVNIHICSIHAEVSNAYTPVPLSSSIGNHIEYFHLRFDAIGKIGLSPLQKCIATILILAYGSFVDSVDDCVSVGERIQCSV